MIARAGQKMSPERRQDMLRLLLPCDAVMAPGDSVTVENAPYVCVRTRVFPGHIQADVRRRSR